jgi:uncharacterized membrane protein YhiD involved in acid resistance
MVRRSRSRSHDRRSRRRSGSHRQHASIVSVSRLSSCQTGRAKARRAMPCNVLGGELVTTLAAEAVTDTRARAGAGAATRENEEIAGGVTTETEIWVAHKIGAVTGAAAAVATETVPSCTPTCTVTLVLLYTHSVPHGQRTLYEQAANKLSSAT